MDTTAELVENYRSARNKSVHYAIALRTHVINSLKHYRQLRGELGQRDIANMLGANVATVCHFENGRLKFLSDDLLAQVVIVYESLGAKHER